MHLSWAAFYEGDTDAVYFDTLIPRILEDIILAAGRRPITVPAGPAVRMGIASRAVDRVAQEMCESAEAYFLLFIHADTGGRAQEEGIANRRDAFAELAHEMCGLSIRRCVYLSPRHETEAWALTDANAVANALGLRRPTQALALPADPPAAERLVDPKRTLDDAVKVISARRRRYPRDQILTAIAQRQSMALLRQTDSFQDFEVRLRRGLRDLGCI